MVKALKGGLIMCATTKMRGMVAVSVGFALLLTIIPSEAAEITFFNEAEELKFFQQKYGQSQEQMGREIMQAGWLKWNHGQSQERLGEFIQSGAQNGVFVQEELGSGIAAAAHLRWEGMKAQERIGMAISNVSAVVAKVDRILGAEAIQARLDAVSLANAQTARRISQDNLIALVEDQEGIARESQTAAEVNRVGGMMAQIAYDTLEGRNTEMIPSEMFTSLRSARAFDAEQNFRLAMVLLAAETGKPMTEILPPTLNAPSTGATYAGSGVSPGWGGFGEYGVWSILSFLYVGYLFCRNAYDLRPQKEEAEESPWTYQKAA